MSEWIKNGNKWCKVERPATRAEIAAAAWHPLRMGLKRTRCGKMVAGTPHLQPLDACERCLECQQRDTVGPP